MSAHFEAGQPSHAETPRLYHNNHDGTFTDVTHLMHLDRAILIMGANFGDLDNDGWLDLYLGTGDSLYTSLLPNRMFRNNAGRDFQDVTTAGGFGHLQKGHGIAFGDLGNNGQRRHLRRDGRRPPRRHLPERPLPQPRHTRQPLHHAQTHGTRSNRSAIGAVIDVTIPDSQRPPRHIYRTVGFGSSFGGNPLRQHIGLGRWNGPVTVAVRWPASSQPQHFTAIQQDHAYILTEDSAQAIPVTYKPFHLPSPAIGETRMQMTGP